MSDMTKPKNRAEEEYFKREEIAKLKKWAAENAAKMADAEKKRLKELHWMKCPNCGMDLKEVEMRTIKVDECPSCGGVFLNHGEIHELLAAEKANEGVFARMFSFFE